jgi:hypothetical protein
MAPRHLQPHRPLLLPNWATSIAIIITFDSVADGTAVDTHYSGVTFASITTMPPMRWSAFARLEGTGAESPRNVISVQKTGFPAFDAQSGGIQATFDVPQLYVSIDVSAVWSPEYQPPNPNQLPTNKPFLQAFDAQGTVLKTVYYPPNFGDPAFGSWQSLIYESTSANIKSVTFSSEYAEPRIFGIFDNFVFAPYRPRLELGLG